MQPSDSRNSRTDAGKLRSVIPEYYPKRISGSLQTSHSIRKANKSEAMSQYIEKLYGAINAKADTKTKEWWERYLKQVIPFRGVKMGDIRTVLHQWYKEEQIESNLTNDQHLELALQLFEGKYAEDKLAGILFLQEIVLKKEMVNTHAVIPRFGSLFNNDLIFDWNISDWFCVKVLGPLVQRYGEPIAREISEWKSAENLWQRRASVVAFVNLAKHGEANFPGFTDLVLHNCEALIQSRERFAQTGAGWVLRELSLANQEKISNFLTVNVSLFTVGGFRYATKKLPKDLKNNLTLLYNNQ